MSNKTLSLIFKPLAKEDLINIGVYTQTNWGEEQRLDYIGKLETACENLILTPHLGKECNYIRLGYRQLKTEYHIIYYSVGTDEITIIRILHEIMDVAEKI